MGRDLGLAFPHVLRRQMAENDTLRSQYHADVIWGAESLDDLTPLELIFAQVALGTLTSDLLVSFGVKPAAAVPYSLGESAMLYGTRAWRHRDEMFQRMQESSLFRTDLAGPCDAARQTWNLPEDQPVDWATGVVSASADCVRAAIGPGMKAYVQIINTADDCVLGGERADVEEVVRRVAASFFEVSGVSTAHCEVARPVREAYRALHYLPTVPAEGVRYYSGAAGRTYDLTADNAADAITAAVLDTIDFPRVVNAAYADGARIFVEVGPGSSCTRMVDSILNGKPHVARAVCVPRQDNVAGFLRVLASLHAEGVPVDLSVLYGGEDDAEVVDEGPKITLPVGWRPAHPRPPLPQGERGEPEPQAPAKAQRLDQSPSLHWEGLEVRSRRLRLPSSSSLKPNPPPPRPTKRISASPPPCRPSSPRRSPGSRPPNFRRRSWSPVARPASRGRSTSRSAWSSLAARSATSSGPCSPRSIRSRPASACRTGRSSSWTASCKSTANRGR